MTWTTTATSIRNSAPWTISTRSPKPRMPTASKSSWTSCRTTAPTCTNGSRPRWPRNPARWNATATSSATAAASTANCRPTTGNPSSAARPGRAWPTASGICTCSIRRSRTSTGRIRTSTRSSRRPYVSGPTTAPTASASTWRTAWPRISNPSRWKSSAANTAWSAC